MLELELECHAVETWVVEGGRGRPGVVMGDIRREGGESSDVHRIFVRRRVRGEGRLGGLVVPAAGLA